MGERFLRRLGLDREPFGEGGFFATEDLDRQLAAAEAHLARSAAPVIVSGTAGVGRSAFLRELRQRTRLTKPIQLAGHGGLTLTAILEAMQVVPTSDPTALAQALAEHQGDIALLLDDADQMSQPELQRLLELQEAVVAEGAAWPLVLTCDATNAATVEARALAAGSREKAVEHIRLPRLGPAQSEAYLRWRLEQAGGDPTTLLDSSALARLYARSNGIPGLLHREAAQVLARRARQQGWSRAKGWPWQSIALTAACLLVASVLVSWVFEAREAEQQPGEQRVTNAELPPEDNAKPKAKGGSSAEIEAGAVATATKGQPAQGEANRERQAPTAAASSNPAGTDRKPPAGTTATPTPQSNTANPPTNSSARPPQNQNRSEEKPRTETGPTQWLAQRAAGHYTIQVLSAREQQTTQRFMSQTGGSAKRLHVVETTHQGEPWHVVITGDYPNIKRARSAINRLPEPLRRFGPFPRAFESLQK